jgi:hypothetical protein
MCQLLHTAYLAVSAILTRLQERLLARQHRSGVAFLPLHVLPQTRRNGEYLFKHGAICMHDLKSSEPRRDDRCSNGRTTSSRVSGFTTA